MFRTSFTYYIPKAKAGPTFSFQHLNKATSKKHLQFVKKGFKAMTPVVMSVPATLLHQEQSVQHYIPLSNLHVCFCNRLKTGPLFIHVFRDSFCPSLTTTFLWRLMTLQKLSYRSVAQSVCSFKAIYVMKAPVRAQNIR